MKFIYPTYQKQTGVMRVSVELALPYYLEIGTHTWENPVANQEIKHELRKQAEHQIFLPAKRILREAAGDMQWMGHGVFRDFTTQLERALRLDIRHR